MTTGGHPPPDIAQPHYYCSAAQLTGKEALWFINTMERRK